MQDPGHRPELCPHAGERRAHCLGLPHVRGHIEVSDPGGIEPAQVRGELRVGVGVGAAEEREREAVPSCEGERALGADPLSAAGHEQDVAGLERPRAPFELEGPQHRDARCARGDADLAEPAGRLRVREGERKARRPLDARDAHI